MVAVNGESSGFYALRKMRQKMLNDDEGLLILKYMPLAFYLYFSVQINKPSLHNIKYQL